MSETFHVDRNKSVNFRSVRNATNQQRFSLERLHPDTGQWERMGDEYYHNDRSGTFGPLAEPTDWRITIQNDQGSSHWTDSPVRREAGPSGPDSIRYRSNDSSGWNPDQDFDDLVVDVSFV